VIVLTEKSNGEKTMVSHVRSMGSATRRGMELSLSKQRQTHRRLPTPADSPRLPPQAKLLVRQPLQKHKPSAKAQAICERTKGGQATYASQ
jgi:hypothetical protein